MAELSEVSVWLRNFEKHTKFMECHVDQLRLAITDADPRELARPAVDNRHAPLAHLFVG